jgi:hypothetical protein
MVQTSLDLLGTGASAVAADANSQWRKEDRMAGQGKYTFKKNDRFDKVAKDWGFQKSAQVWDDPMNRTLKTKRKKPDALEPGDVIQMPYTDKQKLAITNEKLKYLDLIDGEVALARELARQAGLFASSAKIAFSRIETLRKDRADFEKSLKRIDKDIKDTKKVVDTVNEVLQLLASLGATGAKASKASGDDLAKLNKEALKKITGIPAEKAKGAAKEAAVKYLLDEKNEISVVGKTVGALEDSWSKMNSPGFWAQTIARMRTSGKGVTWESWADASTFDFKQEMTNQLHIADRTFLPRLKEAIRDAQAATKKSLECTRLSQAAVDRIKSHQKKKDALPDF